MEKISVIMPAYNAGKTIEATIESVLKQTYSNFELIIVNDGSKDDTDLICKKYLKNKKVKYIYVDNQGVSKCRNLGISIATGNKICFIDSDDFYKEDYLLSMIKYSNYDLVTCGYTNFINDTKSSNISTKEFSTKNFFKYYEVLHANYLFNLVWNKLFDTNIIKKNNINFDSKLQLAEDYKFVFEYCKNANSFKYIDKCLYLYRISNTGLGFSFNKDAGKIKINITDSIYDYYKLNNVDTLYLEKCYIKNLFSLMLNNTKNKKKKIQIIDKTKKSNIYINSLNKINSNLDFKYSLLFKFLKSKNNLILLILINFAEIFDKYKKKKNFGL